MPRLLPRPWSLLALACWSSTALAACGHSIVIRGDDLVLRRSLARLEQTERTIERLPVSAEELRLFMMAESFYRYRFDVPRPKLKAYLAQTAAVVTELPAFQELSAALTSRICASGSPPRRSRFPGTSRTDRV